MTNTNLRASAIATAAAFGTYFAMYAFRKPFTAGAYVGEGFFCQDQKTELVVAQVLGYTVSKFVGIAVVAAMPPHRRALFLLLLVGAAEVALAGFAVVAAPWHLLCLFGNGLSLGMVFGLVLGFLEGRRHTEAMTAGLCASFIVADGSTKSLGAWLLAQGVGERAMPAIAGLIFVLPLVACVAVLARVPPPNAADVASRAERLPMSRADRRAFFHRHGAGLALLVLAYLAITILRSLRADFAPELWRQLGHAVAPVMFTWSEAFVALGVLLATGCTVLLSDNRRAFSASMLLGITGLALCAITLAAHGARLVNGMSFQIAIGLGLYLPYVAVHTTVFERLVAMTRDRGNIGYLMYLADSFGYLGYVVVMLGRSQLQRTDDLLGFFTATAWVTVVVGTLGFLGARALLLRQPRPTAVSASEVPRRSATQTAGGGREEVLQ